MIEHSQIISWHLVRPSNSQILDRQELVELVADPARAPGICDLDGDGRCVVWASRREGVVHPVSGVDVFDAGPDAADLHR